MKDLAPLFRPRSIAIVGASPIASGKLGSWPTKHLLLHEAPVQLSLVNPKYDELDGLPCYPSLSAVPERPDLMLLMVPAGKALPALREAESLGVPAAIVFSSGFGEAGAGSSLDSELGEFCRSTPMAVCGPNTDGIINVVDRIPSGFPPYAGDPVLPVGSVGIVSQSGALVSSLVQRLVANGSGVAFSCAVGNATDLGIGDYLGHLADEPDVHTILVYVEALNDLDGFLAGAARARARGKPVVVLKGGQSPEGASAAASHTGAMVGSYAAFRALCRAHGVAVVDTFEDLAAAPSAAALLHRSADVRRVAVVSGSGAAGGIVTDAARRHGFEVPPLGEELEAKLAPRFDFTRPSNPIDLTGQVVHDPEMHRDVLDALAAAEGYDLIVSASLYGPKAITDRMKRELGDAARSGASIVVYAADGSTAGAEPILRDAGVPVFADVDQLFRTVGALRDAGARRPAASAASPRSEAERARARALVGAAVDGIVPTDEAWELLELYGIPCAREERVASAAEAVAVAERLGTPVAMKASGPDVLHKSDDDLVRLSLEGAAQVARAYDELAPRAQALAHADVVVQEMASGVAEVIVGAVVDREAGPMVVVGAGGILTELVDDLALAPAPITLEEADALLARTRVSAQVDGARGRAAADRASVLSTLVSLSHLVHDLRDELSEIDLNPLVAGPQGAVAVDVLITVENRESEQE